MIDTNTTDVIKKRYERIAPVYNSMDKMMKKSWRKDMLQKAAGHVLEVGVGTGANLPHYPEAVRSVTGIDFSPKMLAKAREVKAPVPVELVEMDAQHMHFADETFDTVVTACVFCSVPDPIKGLKEIRRVLKSHGRVLMLEHMRSDNKMIGRLMDLANPLIVKAWGANINRHTIENIRAAGLDVIGEKQYMGTVIRELVLAKR